MGIPLFNYHHVAVPLLQGSLPEAVWADRSFPTRAACIDRRADLELAAGRHRVAERLSTLAAELRERLAPEARA